MKYDLVTIMLVFKQDSDGSPRLLAQLMQISCIDPELNHGCNVSKQIRYKTALPLPAAGRID